MAQRRGGQRQPRWPIAVLDFEASALDFGFPIEAGLAIWRSPDSTIESWSSLIRPTQEWADRLDWTAQAQAIHGIMPSDLAEAPHPRDVAETILEALSRLDVACDGGARDREWWELLLFETPREATFQLVDDGLIAAAGGERFQGFLATTKTPHRARADAERLVHAYAYALRLEPTVVDWRR